MYLPSACHACGDPPARVDICFSEIDAFGVSGPAQHTRDQSELGAQILLVPACHRPLGSNSFVRICARSRDRHAEPLAPPMLVSVDLSRVAAARLVPPRRFVSLDCDAGQSPDCGASHHFQWPRCHSRCVHAPNMYSEVCSHLALQRWAL